MKLPAPFLHVQMGAGDDRRGRHCPGFRSLVDRKKSPFEGPSTIESRAWAAALEFTVKEGTGFCTRQPSASNLATKSFRYERSLSPVSTQPYVEAASHISGIMPGVGKTSVYTVILFALPSSSGHTRISSQPSHGQSLLSLDSLITNHSTATDTQSFFKRKSWYEHLKGLIYYLQRLQLKKKLATKAHHTPITRLLWLCFSHPPVHVAPQSICSSLPFIFAIPLSTLFPIHLQGNMKAFLVAREISMLGHYNSIGFALMFWGKGIFIFRVWPSGLSWTFEDERWPTCAYMFPDSHASQTSGEFIEARGSICVQQSLAVQSPQESYGCVCRNPSRGEEGLLNFFWMYHLSAFKAKSTHQPMFKYPKHSILDYYMFSCLKK